LSDKTQSQQKDKRFAATANPEWKTAAAGWHDAEKESKTPLMAQSTGKPTTSLANQAFTHGAIFVFLSQPSLSHNTARSYFLRNNVERKITE
jgi:hypothetical protein